MRKKVIIVGGGLSGLAAARAFQLRDIPVSVFERDESVDARKQGYTISVKPNTLNSFKRLKLDVEKLEKSSYKPDSFTFFNHLNQYLIKFTGEEIGIQPSRYALRDLLLSSLKPGTVQWGKKFLKFEQQDTNQMVHVKFEDGTVETCDLLIGADGSKSKVREQLIGDRPIFYNIISIVEPRIKDKLFEKQMVLSHDGVAMLATSYYDPNPIGLWGLFMKATEQDIERYKQHPEEVKRKMIQVTNHWKHPLKDLIPTSDASTYWISGIYDYDITNLEKLKTSRVVLIGDSAHAMTPFRGQGGNMAIYDGAACLDLDFTEESIARFHRDMIQRTKPWIMESRKGISHIMEGALMRDMMLRVLNLVFNKKKWLLAFIVLIVALVFYSLSTYIFQ